MPLAEMLIPARRATAADDGILDPLSNFWYRPIGRRTGSNVNVTDESALTYSGVWAARMKLAGIVASLPCKTYRKTSPASREEAADHPLYRILHDEPNDDEDSFTFFERLTDWWINWGNGVCEIERLNPSDRFSPIANLWPIHPSRVRYFRAGGQHDRRSNRDQDNDGRLLYAIKGNDPRESIFEKWGIFNIVGHLSKDGLVGRGVLQHAMESIGIGLAIEQHQGAFFGNGTVVSGVLQHPGKPSQEARDNMRREWREIHEDASKHFKVAPLWEGVTFQPTSFNADESQMIESARFRINDVARWYDLPPHALRLLQDYNYSTVDAERISLVVDSLAPRLTRMEKAIKRQLFNPADKRDHYVKFSVDAMLRGDPEKRANVNKTKFMHGRLTINEWLAQDEQNPIGPAGDQRYVPANLVPLDRAGSNPRGGFGGNDNDEAIQQLTSQIESLRQSDGEHTAALAALKDALANEQAARSNGTAEHETQMKAAMLAAAQDHFDYVYRERLTKEIKAVARATNLADIESFYARHSDELTSDLRSAVEGYADVAGCDADTLVNAVVERHVAESRASLPNVLAGDADTSRQRVERLTESWSGRTINLTELLGEITHE
jgi:HK97 family phage portal protein